MQSLIYCVLSQLCFTCLHVYAFSKKRYQNSTHSGAQLNFATMRTVTRIAGCHQTVTEIVQEHRQSFARHVCKHYTLFLDHKLCTYWRSEHLHQLRYQNKVTQKSKMAEKAEQLVPDKHLHETRSRVCTKICSCPQRVKGRPRKGAPAFPGGMRCPLLWTSYDQACAPALHASAHVSSRTPSF
jgi:hypothetical protein